MLVRFRIGALCALLGVALAAPAVATVPPWIGVPAHTPLKIPARATPLKSQAKFSARRTAPRQAVRPAAAAKVVQARRQVPRRPRRPRTRFRRQVQQRQIPAVPMRSAVPRAAAALLAHGDLLAAYQRLQMAPDSLRNRHLMGEIQRVAQHSRGLAKVSDDPGKYYRDLGVAYHNLLLFLQGEAMWNKDFYRKAHRAYAKAARRGATAMARAEIELLRAAIDMSAGRQKRGLRRFTKRVDPQQLEGRFAGLAALAGYHAAAGSTDDAIAALQGARTLDTKDQLGTWIAIGDDFTPIANTTAFRTFLTPPKATATRRTRRR